MSSATRILLAPIRLTLGGREPFANLSIRRIVSEFLVTHQPGSVVSDQAGEPMGRVLDPAEPNGVSVVMATYNGAEFITEQLRSLNEQTRLPDELIVSDDGSDDATLELVDAFRAHARFPVIVRSNPQNLGYGANFLSAAAIARYRYIAFCDQDDVWHPEKLAVAVDSLDRTGTDLLVHPARVIDHHGTAVDGFDQGITGDAIHQPLELAPWSVFYGCSMVFRRDLLQLIDPAERGDHTFEHHGPLSHDLWVYFLATSVGHVRFEGTALIDYRRHARNVTPTLRGRTVRGWLRSLGVAAHPELRRDDIARHRSRLMSRLAESTADPAMNRTATRAAAYWDRIAGYERLRQDLYSARRSTSRGRVFLRLTVLGGYRSHRRGGLGPRLAIKDVLVGLLQARRWRPRRM